MNMSIIIASLVFMSVLLFIAGASSYRNYLTGSKKIIEKIQSPDASLPYGQPSGVFSPVDAGFKGRFLGFIGSLGNWIKPDSDEQVSNMRTTLMQAGYRRLTALPVYYGFKLFLAAALPIGFFNVKVLLLQPVPSMNLMIILIAFGLTGFFLPNLWLRYRISDRKRQMFEGFPDALDLLVVCVEAGMGMDAAINRVGEEMKLRNRIISEEFKLMSLELRAGKARREVMRNMAMRTDLDDIRSLMSLLIQTDKFGTSVAQALRVHSDSMRTKRSQKVEEIAAKLPVKLLFPLILFIFPALLVVLTGPAIIKIYRALLPVLGDGH